MDLSDDGESDSTDNDTVDHLGVEPIPTPQMRGSADAQLVVRGRGPFVWQFAAYSVAVWIWTVTLLTAAYASAAATVRSRVEMLLVVLIPALILANVLLLVRVRRSGIYLVGGVFELRTPFGRMNLGGQAVQEFTLHDSTIFHHYRMVRVLLKDQTFVNFHYISWGNTLNSFHYGTGREIVPSKRQAEVLSVLNSAATELPSAEVNP